MNMEAINILNNYKKRLASIPAPGGNGCHTALLAVANLGALAGLSQERIFQDIRNHIPPGKRRVQDREIFDAIKKALNDHNSKQSQAYVSKVPSAIINRNASLQRIINQAKIHDEADLWDLSPVRLLEEP